MARATFTDPLDYNRAGDAYRDQVVAALADAGQPMPQHKWARAAGGFLAENGGDVGEALSSATHGGFYEAAAVLAVYSTALKASDQRLSVAA